MVRKHQDVIQAAESEMLEYKYFRYEHGDKNTTGYIHTVTASKNMIVTIEKSHIPCLVYRRSSRLCLYTSTHKEMGYRMLKHPNSSASNNRLSS